MHPASTSVGIDFFAGVKFMLSHPFTARNTPYCAVKPAHEWQLHSRQVAAFMIGGFVPRSSVLALATAGVVPAGTNRPTRFLPCVNFLRVANRAFIYFLDFHSAPGLYARRRNISMLHLMHPLNPHERCASAVH
jgi:hypothetical protein